MLSSLLVSVYVIYLYRKLNAEEQPQPAAAGGGKPSVVETEIVKLNERIAALESRVR